MEATKRKYEAAKQEKMADQLVEETKSPSLQD